MPLDTAAPVIDWFSPAVDALLFASVWGRDVI